MATTLIMSAKMATPDYLKTKGLYDVHDVTNETASRDSNNNVNLAMWAKFGNSSISVREVIITSTL